MWVGFHMQTLCWIPVEKAMYVVSNAGTKIQMNTIDP